MKENKVSDRIQNDYTHISTVYSPRDAHPLNPQVYPESAEEISRPGIPIPSFYQMSDLPKDDNHATQRSELTSKPAVFTLQVSHFYRDIRPAHRDKAIKFCKYAFYTAFINFANDLLFLFYSYTVIFLAAVSFVGMLSFRRFNLVLSIIYAVLVCILIIIKIVFMVIIAKPLIILIFTFSILINAIALAVFVIAIYWLWSLNSPELDYCKKYSGPFCCKACRCCCGI